MISDINVSATFSITVSEDYYSQMSAVVWIGEHTSLYAPTTVTLYPFYSTLSEPHIQSIVADR
jgi:hypothetical protein